VPIDASELLRWERTAHELIQNGTTSKDPKIVAAILAEYAIGVAPSTISRRRKVHHSTVGRILEGLRSWRDSCAVRRWSTWRDALAFARLFGAAPYPRIVTDPRVACSGLTWGFGVCSPSC